MNGLLLRNLAAPDPLEPVAAGSFPAVQFNASQELCVAFSDTQNIHVLSGARWCNSCSILAFTPTMQRFSDCRILMYVGDHPPPHVHVVLRDGRDALIWIAAQKAFLLTEWQRYNS